MPIAENPEPSSGPQIGDRVSIVGRQHPWRGHSGEVTRVTTLGPNALIGKPGALAVEVEVDSGGGARAGCLDGDYRVVSHAK